MAVKHKVIHKALIGVSDFEMVYLSGVKSDSVSRIEIGRDMSTGEGFLMEYITNTDDNIILDSTQTSYNLLFPKLPQTLFTTPSFDSSAVSVKSSDGHLCVLVNVEVKSGCESEFIDATLVNCRNSMTESGIIRFDLLQNEKNPSNFILVEVYSTEDAPVKHKETEHYNTWRNTVESMMNRPRTAIKLRTEFPIPLLWKYSSDQLE